jgi:iron complex outermembrane receptor protein
MRHSKKGLKHAAWPCTLAGNLLLSLVSTASAQTEQQLEPVVVSASRGEQRLFDASASISAVELDPFETASPLVNMSELLSTVPGVLIRERQNYAQDLQLSIRGFGTRSTFGVRGVRILIDGIPATMPDGQGQAATATLSSAERIEVLRGPVAQLYGNAAGGVVQVFTADPPIAPQTSYGKASLGFGSDGQEQTGITVGVAGNEVGGLVDLSHFETEGYRDHSAAERTQFNGKIKWQPSTSTTLTGILNVFELPLAQDPLGLTREQFAQAPRQVVPRALTFDTVKTVTQEQAGLVMEHRFNDRNVINARIYEGTRDVTQRLAFAGSDPGSSGGVIDLGNDYRGIGTSWTHSLRSGDLPLSFTLGFEADELDQHRRGFVNDNGTSGELRRNEYDTASNTDVYGQAEWFFAPAWKSTIGLRLSRVKLSIDDRYVTGDNPDDSGSVEYSNASPVLGLTWFARDNLNLYANIGRGFETPTLTEVAYSADASGANLGLEASHSLQGEIGLKWRSAHQSLDMALFTARSSDEIVPIANQSGRTIFQNVDKVERTGLEVSWQLQRGRFATQLAYTLLHARFEEGFSAGADRFIAAGNRLPGVPMHSLSSHVEYRIAPKLTAAVEMRADSKTYVDDINSDAASGYAVINLRAGKEFRAGPATWYLYGRIDNVFDRDYAGSVIVNEGNGRFFEPAPGRRFFIGLRAALDEAARSDRLLPADAS